MKIQEAIAPLKMLLWMNERRMLYLKPFISDEMHRLPSGLFSVLSSFQQLYVADEIQEA